MEKAVSVALMNVMKHGRSAANPPGAREDAHAAAKLAGERIDHESPDELNQELEKDFQHPRIIALIAALE